MSRFVSERLGPSHDLGRFRTGVPALDSWLVRSAANVQAKRMAQTFVWRAENEQVVAYFSLAAHLLVREALPARVGCGSPDTLPAILVARLALDATLHGQGLGGELLWDALARSCAAAEIVAARLVVVDAIDDRASAFYQHHGFVGVPGNPHRLVQKTSDIVAALRG